MKITTNNIPRDLLYSSDVPDEVLDSEFDWLDDRRDTDGFIHYRNTWYHISQFIVNRDENLNYHGAFSESYFSGVLIRLVDHDQVIMAGYSC
jgi:hypothetical protein